MTERKWGRWLLGLGLIGYCAIATAHCVVVYRLARAALGARMAASPAAFLDDQARQYAIILGLKYLGVLALLLLVMALISPLVRGFGPGGDNNPKRY